MPGEAEINQTYEQLNSAARYTVGLPFSQSWENDVMETLWRLEQYENKHGLENKSHDLLENAILDKLALQDDMPADELEAYLRTLGVPIETGGEVRHDGTTGPRGPNTSDTRKTTGKFQPEPKAARIIANLIRNHDIEPTTDLKVSMISQSANFRKHQEPYWVLDVKPWERQIAICNVSGEGSFVGRGLRNRESWEELLSNKTKLSDKSFQIKEGLIKINKTILSDERYTAVIVDACKNGVQNARVTEQTILDCLYHNIAEKNELAGQKSPNLLNPHHSYIQYNGMLSKGKIDGYPPGSGLPQVLINDLTRHAKKCLKQNNYLPDETTDEIIDKDLKVLSEVRHLGDSERYRMKMVL